MSITWQEIEAAGYLVTGTGTILGPDGKPAKQYVIKGVVNVQVYLPRQEGKKKPWTYVRLHLMVASKFVPNPNNYRHVAFKKGKSYRPSNLVWVVPADAVRTQARRDKQYALMMLNEGLMHWREARDLGVGEERAYKIWRKNNATV